VGGERYEMRRRERGKFRPSLGRTHVPQAVLRLQKHAPERSREVLKAGRACQLGEWAQIALLHLHHLVNRAFEVLHGVSVLLLDPPVPFFVLGGVQSLLLEKEDDVLPQLGVVVAQLPLVVAHCVYEESLAGRKRCRQRVEHLGHGRVAPVPVVWCGRYRAEVHRDPARRYAHPLRRSRSPSWPVGLARHFSRHRVNLNMFEEVCMTGGASVPDGCFDINFLRN